MENQANDILHRIFIKQKCIEINDAAIEDIRRLADAMKFTQSHFGFFGDFQTAIEAFEKVTKNWRQEMQELQIELKAFGVDCKI